MEYRNFRYHAGQWRSGLASIALAEDIDVVGADRNYPFVARFNGAPIGFYRTLDKAISALERFTMRLRLAEPWPLDAEQDRADPAPAAEAEAEVETGAAGTNGRGAHDQLMAYCIACGRKTSMSAPVYETNRQGRPAAKGPCIVCGRILYTLMSGDRRQEDPGHAAA